MDDCTLIDGTRPLGAETPVWPGDEPFKAVVAARVENEGYYLRRICFSEHASTHIDAPAHFISNGATVDALPPLITGWADLALLDDLSGGKWIGRDLLAQRLPSRPRGRVLILYNGSKWNGGDPCVHTRPLTGEAAELIVERGYRLVVTDAPGPDCPPFPAHRVFLSRGVPIVENALIKNTIVSAFDKGVRVGVIVAPIKLSGGSGGPVRLVFLVGNGCCLPTIPQRV